MTFLLLLLLLTIQTGAFAADTTAPTEVPVESPTAKSLVENMRGQLPHDPLAITGSIILRKRHGIVLREFKFKMELNWGASPATAKYTIMDALGTPLDEMVVTRRPGQETQYSYTAPEPGAGDAQPDLTAGIRGTDISWTDITLSFLWWNPVRILGVEEIKGRRCYMVEVVPPDSTNAASTHYSKAVLWIDDKLHMLLQAGAYDIDDQPVRTLWIKSFKKINERWMIKDMEIESQAKPYRTKLLIDDVNAEAPE